MNVIASQLDKMTLQVSSTVCTKLEDLERENHITVSYWNYNEKLVLLPQVML